MQRIVQSVHKLNHLLQIVALKVLIGNLPVPHVVAQLVQVHLQSQIVQINLLSGKNVLIDLNACLSLISIFEHVYHFTVNIMCFNALIMLNRVLCALREGYVQYE